MKRILPISEELRGKFAKLIDKDTDAFNKVMEAYRLPKETADQQALRSTAIQEATKEAALVPLEVMKHTIDALALTKVAAEKGNAGSVSDAGVGASMLHAACESAALNVQINLNSITDTEFVGWRAEEVQTLLRTSEAMAEEILELVKRKIQVA
jgi:formiminotetrahydrofolate cyclodeaminase